MANTASQTKQCVLGYRFVFHWYTVSSSSVEIEKIAPTTPEKIEKGMKIRFLSDLGS